MDSIQNDTGLNRPCPGTTLTGAMAKHIYRDQTIVISRVPIYGSGVQAGKVKGEGWEVTIDGRLTKGIVRLGSDSEEKILAAAQQYIDEMLR